MKKDDKISFSISEALKEPIYTKNVFMDKISINKKSSFKEDFNNAWKEFIKSQISSKNNLIYNLLISIKYKLFNNNIIILYFSSRLDLIKFHRIHKFMLSYLQKKLNNYYLYFEMHINCCKKNNFSSEEKFLFLSKKNFQLNILKKILNLDFYD